MSADLVQLKIEPNVSERWNLSSARSLGGRLNHQWLVERAGQRCVLRRYAAIHTDIDYELNVLRGLVGLGWPVPQVMEPPIECGGASWCLFSFLPGSQTSKIGVIERRFRGRLLAELHESTASLVGLGQRGGSDRTDTILADPALTAAVAAYERIRPDIGHMMRWHIDRACESLEQLRLDDVEQIVLHSDFTSWNLLFEGDELSGIVDFESTHLDLRVADFALAWRGKYDAVIHGYEEVHPLSEVDWQLLVPVFWGWLFRGVKQEIGSMVRGDGPSHGFDWQAKQLARRSPLFGTMAEPYSR